VLSLHSNVASNNKHTWSAHKEIKKLTSQRECCKAHDSYISNLIDSDDGSSNDNNKRLWSYIKSKTEERSMWDTFIRERQLYKVIPS